MRVEDFVQRHPVLFHMAEEGAWAGIRQMGLLSTTALLDKFEITGEERARIESRIRDRIEEIRHPKHGRAFIRDNKPLRLRFLEQCLVDMSVEEWLRVLNRKVFFWVSEKRLETLLNARPYRRRAHDVLTVDARVLLAAHVDSVRLAPINTGAALYPSAPKRGRDTFKTLEEYDVAAKKRRRDDTGIVELTVDYSVPEIERMVLRAERRCRDQPSVVLWSQK